MSSLGDRVLEDDVGGSGWVYSSPPAVSGSGHDTLTTSYPLWTLDRETVARLADEGGIAAPKGKAGAVLMFHSNIVHASPPNISPWGRVIVYLSLCRVDNHIRRFKRPEWIAHSDFTPIQPLSDDCLLELEVSPPPPPGRLSVLGSVAFVVI